MKRQWRLRRQTSPKLDGQQRWDRAYQLLLKWSQEPEPNNSQPTKITPMPTQEIRDDIPSSRRLH